MKKILIVSNFFYPEITPRAFRTTELVKEFCRQGDMVTLVLPNKEIYRNDPLKFDNLTTIYSSSKLKKLNTTKILKESDGKEKKISIRKQLVRYFKDLALYFFPREIFLVYDRGLTSRLKAISGEFDVLISISQPLSIHVSVLLAILTNPALKYKISIAEFSDPMYNGQYQKTFPTNWGFGFWFAAMFKYFVVPVPSAIPAFRFFKKKANIKVIPQGFDLSTIRRSFYVANPVPTFAYAGRFYKELRDPEYFLTFLKTIKKPFVFKLYIDRTDLYFTSLIKKFDSMVYGKITLCDIIPRDELINELSKVDFLINFNNENSKMVPSKLVDYALTGRPILSFNSKTFSETAFSDFMSQKYEAATTINLENYDIKNIVKDFKRLF